MYKFSVISYSQFSVKRQRKFYFHDDLDNVSCFTVKNNLTSLCMLVKALTLENLSVPASCMIKTQQLPLNGIKILLGFVAIKTGKFFCKEKIDKEYIT